MSAARKISSLPAHSAISEKTLPSFGWHISDYVCLLILTLTYAAFFVPVDVSTLSNRLVYDVHAVAYIIGPALYEYGNHLIPGIDYFNQYSLISGALFSHFLSADYFQVFRTFILFMVGCTFIYTGLLFLCLRDWFQSRYWAMSLTLLSIILIFHKTGDMVLFDPSGWPPRYLLMPVAAYLFVSYLQTNKSKWFCALIAVLGVSLALNTEYGIYLILVSSAGLVLTRNFSRKAIASSVLLTIGALLVWWIILGLVFGSDVFRPAFLERTLDAIILFGGGYGAMVTNWNGGLACIFNIFGPVLLVDTIIVATRKKDFELEPQNQRAILYLLFFSLLGVLNLAKWLNRSIDVIWIINGTAFLLTLGYWLYSPALGLTNKKYRLAFKALALLVMVVLIFSFSDPRMVLGKWMVSNKHPASANIVDLAALKQFPGYVQHKLGTVNTHTDIATYCDGRPEKDYWPTEKDIALIHKFVPPHERAMVVACADYIYLIAAQRAPKSYVTPLPATIDTKDLRRSMEDVDYIFVEYNKQGRLGMGLLNTFFYDVLQNFTVVEVGDKLTAMKLTKADNSGK